MGLPRKRALQWLSAIVWQTHQCGRSHEKNRRTGDGVNPPVETPEAWAFRLTEKMRGLLKEELAEYGGGEAFLRWVRGYDEDEA